MWTQKEDTGCPLLCDSLSCYSESGSLTEVVTRLASSQPFLSPSSTVLGWQACISSHPAFVWFGRSKLGSPLLLTSPYLQPQSISCFQNHYSKLWKSTGKKILETYVWLSQVPWSLTVQMYTLLEHITHESNHASTRIFDKFTSCSDTRSKGSNHNTWYKNIIFTFLELAYRIFASATQQRNTVMDFLSSPQSADSWHNIIRTWAVETCRRKQFSDKITLFLAKQTHVVEYLMWLLASEVIAVCSQIELFHIAFQVVHKCFHLI